MDQRIACFITVRTGSTRLPGKALLSISGRRTIEHVIDRVKRVKAADSIVLCTSDDPSDDVLEQVADRAGILCFRGSMEDKLVRWLGAVDKFTPDYFVTIDGDDLFCDPELIDTAIKQVKDDPVIDFLKAPEGLACGAFTYCIKSAALRRACEIKGSQQTEMMWVYFTETGLFRVADLNVTDPVFFNDRIRLTLDYPEDLDFFRAVFDKMRITANTVPLRKIISMLNVNTDISGINISRQDEFLANQRLKTSLVLKGNTVASCQPGKGWRFGGNELRYVKEVLDSGFASATTGSMNQRLEKAFAERLGVAYAITSNSGTSTLHQALAALGVGHGDEVIVPALSPVMCGFAVLHAGATPVFADLDADTFLIDPASILANITARTKAIMAVNLYGLPCNMDAIMRIATDHDLYVLEDCAQCFLGRDDKGRLAGTVGHVGSFSFENSKHMSTGDGGILITNDEVLAERMRKFGGIGFKNIRAASGQVRRSKDVFQDPKYLRHDSFGWNYRLPEVAAAVGLAQLERLDGFVARRQCMAAKYLEAIAACAWLKPQKVPPGYVNSYYTFAVRYSGEPVTGANWYDFRKKHMQYGGDGIYSAWSLIYREPSMRLLNEEGRYFRDLPARGESYKGFLDNVNCPVAEELQPMLLQFTTNQATAEQMEVQRDALKRAIADVSK